MVLSCFRARHVFRASICLVISGMLAYSVPSVPQDDVRPNVVLIVADDMGYTDLGVYGSEISTPNIDELARGGTLLTQMYATPQCATTRAALLTGRDNHIAGVGAMFPGPSTRGKPGYEGFLSPNLVTLPEVLGAAGYHTYMVGKWHVGMRKGQLPTDRGFERSYGILSGAAGHFDLSFNNPTGKAAFSDNGVMLDALPDDFYSTRSYTDRIISDIESGRKDGKPFFAYLAYTSPHWPLMVPEDELDRYAGQYDDGYDELHKRRIAGAIDAGVLVNLATGPSDWNSGPGWDDLDADTQNWSSRAMEIYAAMVQNLDDNIGRLIAYLDETGELDNTLIIFMSDNGAESDDVRHNPNFGKCVQEKYDHSYEMMGRKGSWVSYGQGWAAASSAGYRAFKGFTTEGGIRVPAFVWQPGVVETGVISDNLVTANDVMPTILEMVGGLRGNNVDTDDPAVLLGMGHSVAGALTGEVATTDDSCRAWELHGQRALRCGDWKIVWTQSPLAGFAWFGENLGDGAWKLYDLSSDPAENNDLTGKHPKRAADMVEQWDAYAAANNVILEYKYEPPGPGGRQQGMGN